MDLVHFHVIISAENVRTLDLRHLLYFEINVVNLLVVVVEVVAEVVVIVEVVVDVEIVVLVEVVVNIVSGIYK